MEIKNKKAKKAISTFTDCKFAIFNEEDKTYKLMILGYGENETEVKIIFNKEEIKKLKELINKK